MTLRDHVKAKLVLSVLIMCAVVVGVALCGDVWAGEVEKVEAYRVTSGELFETINEATIRQTKIDTWRFIAKMLGYEDTEASSDLDWYKWSENRIPKMTTILDFLVSYPTETLEFLLTRSCKFSLDILEKQE